MARKALLTEKFHARSRRGQAMRVMASPTPETISAAFLTTTLPEFLKVAYHFDRLGFRWGPGERRNVVRQKFSGTKSVQRSSCSGNVDLTHQVASSADAVTAKGVETNGVDNVS